MAVFERPYKIPQSVLVVIHTPALDVLLIRRVDVGTWQSVTGSRAHPEEPLRHTAVRDRDAGQMGEPVQNDKTRVVAGP